MRKIREYFIAHYFMGMKNGKFLIVEGAYIYMLVACAILAYGVLYHFNSLRLIPFILPFLFGAYMVLFAPKIKSIDEVPGWRTKLRLLADPKMNHVFNTPYDELVEKRLRERWVETYGEYFKDIQFVRLQKWQPLALPILAIIIALIYG